MRPSHPEAIAAAREQMDNDGEPGCEHDPRKVCEACHETALASAIREIHAELDAQRTPLPTVTDCGQCGVCCTEQAGLPISWYLGAYPLGDKGTLPGALLAEMEATLAEWQAGFFPPDHSPCVWYDAATRRCRHYEHRPQICRDFEVGGEGCLRWRARGAADLPDDEDTIAAPDDDREPF
jgi:Fe-S-cluster containining protein